MEPPSADVSRLSLSALLSVGLAPGLTNLLALRVYDDLGGDADRLGPRLAHPFSHSDQHTLRRTLAVPDATTRLTFDSRIVTSLSFGAHPAGMFRAARGVRGRELLTALLTPCSGRRRRLRRPGRREGGDRERRQAMTGTNQSRITGLVAARMAEAVVAGRVAGGVHHIEEIAAFLDLPEQLAEAGTRVWVPESGGRVTIPNGPTT